ncbi:uncharacterized protein Dwil_GK28119, isoform B [Drosophila willistoni]|uniref:Uncharacterized protein, isoform A n=1 Tax=Drosophila willistoni TaxID=7260 RepID=A0A0Q9WZX3_DROWI|nr:uncharacterized protein LOC26530121 [Drosophila willistoni]XP_046866563.1 uncharacterized protein LOC26530121 [Drosophila willistoni]XP_046866564.1 uncharacterized protein LOC26530121 [Drosophila willistoni]KRF98743.1 uncharacterized protein Dwil_GK28119, isoform A [Drosophila willistoni]KRF98744.1 uncharacterized protein Dwil_GK28119, isoform B [Drosophila willistoni]
MKSIWLIFCLVVCCHESQVFGATAFGNFSRPDHPGKCVIDNSTILDNGQNITDKYCRHFLCGFDGWVQEHSCISKLVEEPCKIGKVKYPGSEYPKCCINVLHCPDGDQEF